LGIAAWNKRDWANAVQNFKNALALTPDDAVIKGNLEKAETQLEFADKERKEREEREGQEIRARLEREKREVQEKFERDKTDALNSLKSISSGNLDIKDSTGNKINGSDFGLKGVDDSNTSNVVDARDVPTGLPRAVAEAIPHTPVGDRVRKGFQAIQAHDWKVALAWFQDAVNHDPGDPSLTRLVDLAKFTLNYREKTSPSVPNTQLPNQSPASASGNDTAIKPADDGFHGDWVTYAAVVGIAARARAEKVYEDFKARYGDRNAVGRAIAVSKAMRGDGYSKEELNADLERARAVYEKVLRDRKIPRDPWSNPPVYGRISPMKPKVYPDSPWGKFLRFYDNLVNPPEVYSGPEMDEVTLGGKG
jgi:GNAT superfamily N-acetyltransferase